MRRAAALAVLAGCTGDVAPDWQLSHDRVIAVRAAPPRIVSGETSRIDALLGHQGQPPDDVDPDTAEVVSPASLAAALGRQATRWTVTAPGDDALAAARSELGLDPGAPVPLQLRVGFTELGQTALKIVWLGQHTDNPVIDPVTINGMDGLAEAQLTVPAGVDVPLVVNFDATHNINWLTSCGTMHDFDLAMAHLRVEPEDPHAGTLAIVVRDTLGGVAWQLWPITATAP
ncbi:MAG TPA: hypothetical protein VHT91_07145 [Kofleriaceae bacterium]|jgi:hypothetical protein|nr:hypothetical protein [Kofleriaceae bacterium]